MTGRPHPLAGDPIEELTFGPLPADGPLTAHFDAAIRRLNDARGSVYGHPADDFRRVALMKAVVADCPHTLIRHALEMILVKVARLIQSPDHLDSIEDIAGYARTMVMILDREANQPGPSPSAG
jgi:Domain of unknown function (DUF6378)